MTLDAAEEVAGELPCCCSLSSCDDDNCSYYEGESGGSNGGCIGGAVNENIKIEITHSYQARGKQPQQQQQQKQQLQLRSKQQQQQQLPPKLPKRNVRMSSGEELLIRQQLLRKVSKRWEEEKKETH